MGVSEMVIQGATPPKVRQHSTTLATPLATLSFISIMQEITIVVTLTTTLLLLDRYPVTLALVSIQCLR